MNLLCIKTAGPSSDGILPIVKEGDDATSNGAVKVQNIDYYVLNEDTRIMDGVRVYYPCACFVPLNGPDERDYADKILDAMPDKVVFNHS
jgi:hypothetical protein